MKKIISLLMIAVSVFLLSSCDGEYEKDIFYSDEMLKEHNLEGMPVPNLENSRIYDDEIYLNLTKDEYDAYTKELVDYILGREDIYHAGRYRRTYLMGEIMPYWECVLLDEEAYGMPSLQIAFSSTEELSGDYEFLSDHTTIRISYEERELTNIWGEKTFSYTTYIHIGYDEYPSATINPCAEKHTFGDEITQYPCIGSDRVVTEKTCIYCGGREQSDFVSDHKFYKIRVAEGKDHIRNVEDETISGWITTVTVPIHCDVDVVVEVNGQKIPMTSYDDRYWYYSFVMPCCDVEIKAYTSGEGPAVSP